MFGNNQYTRHLKFIFRNLLIYLFAMQLQVIAMCKTLI